MHEITVTGFRAVPPFAQGLVRDLRVRWALEEAGWPYHVELVEPADLSTESFRKRQPFGQVPVFTDGDRTLFESGAIVHRIATAAPALMPEDPDARDATVAWMFAALNTMELPLQTLSVLDLQHADQDWAKLRRPSAVAAVQRRLADLSSWLEGRDYLLGRFTAADILMTTVLRLLRHTDLVAGHPTLAAYLARCEARPSFQKALAEQMEGYASHAAAQAAE